VNAITPTLRAAHDANRAGANTIPNLTNSIASPDGCEVCGNTVEIHGYDCLPCEMAYNADQPNDLLLAVKLADVLVAHVRGAEA
jgi:hypothetical protein